MKKIVQRTRRFEKRFKKLTSKFQKLFIKKLRVFLEDEFHPSLKTHPPKGNRKGEFSLSISNDLRAIYRKETHQGKTSIIFTFIDLGSHNLVY